jgi:hypothetical protein
MSMRNILRWVTAADERERLAQVRESIANREAGHRSPKQHVLAERDRLRRTIWLRLGTEFVLLGTLIAATAAKLSGVLDGTPAQSGQAGRVERDGESGIRKIDFDRPGMMKTFVIVNLPEDQKAVDALHDKIGEALKLALQHPDMAEAYRISDIDIMVTPDIRGTAQAALERMGAGKGAGKGVDLRTWSGDAMTLSTKRAGEPMKHLMMLEEKLVADPLKLGVAIDHELGHVKTRNTSGAMIDVTEEEIAVFSGSLIRLRALVERLRATNGPNDPMARRLESEILPHEERLLAGWNSQRRR